MVTRNYVSVLKLVACCLFLTSSVVVFGAQKIWIAQHVYSNPMIAPGKYGSRFLDRIHQLTLEKKAPSQIVDILSNSDENKLKYLLPDRMWSSFFPSLKRFIDLDEAPSLIVIPDYRFQPPKGSGSFIELPITLFSADTTIKAGQHIMTIRYYSHYRLPLELHGKNANVALDSRIIVTKDIPPFTLIDSGLTYEAVDASSPLKGLTLYCLNEEGFKSLYSGTIDSDVLDKPVYYSEEMRQKIMYILMVNYGYPYELVRGMTNEEHENYKKAAQQSKNIMNFDKIDMKDRDKSKFFDVIAHTKS